MKFSYHHGLCAMEQYVPLAQAAEKLNFDGITMPESICYPKAATSQYPYTDDGSREFLNQTPFIDPFILTTHLAAVTKKLHFTTSVAKLAIRQPVLVAKQLASLAVITDNRFSFGVGISPWQEDFEIAQIPFAKRGKRMNETIEIVQGLLSGEYFGYDGEIFQIPEIRLCPVPNKPVPILVGGHSDAALKRAARLGDGWISAGGSYEELKTMITKLQEFRKEYQRDHLPFCVSVATAEAFSIEGIERLQQLGVDEVCVAFRDIYNNEKDDKSVEEKIGMLQWYNNTIIEKTR